MKPFLALFLCPLLMASAWAIGQEQTQDTQAKYRLVVSFTSRASGIDRTAKRNIDEYISTYEKEKGVKLAKEVTRWGKEGEMDYCFKLAELSQGDQESFVLKIKSLRSERVTVSENAACSHKK